MHTPASPRFDPPQRPVPAPAPSSHPPGLPAQAAWEDAHGDAVAWRLDDIAWDRIEMDRIRSDESMFLLLAGASFVEIGSDLYSANLSRYFDDDAEVSDWLIGHWQPEEVQHGLALRTYVRLVWPEFDWQRAYDRFFAEYAPLCTVEAFEPTRSLEMVARCAIETGTSVYYRALHDLAAEPVLRDLTERIRRDEVRHYKRFFAFHRKYEAIEPSGRRRILGALMRRMLEIRRGDADIAIRHVYEVRHGLRQADAEKMRRLSGDLGRLIRAHYPVEPAARMFLKPLALPRGSEQLTIPLARVAQRWLS